MKINDVSANFNNPNSNFFINKNSQGRKYVREKSTYFLKFGFSHNIWGKVSTESGTSNNLISV